MITPRDSEARPRVSDALVEKIVGGNYGTRIVALVENETTYVWELCADLRDARRERDEARRERDALRARLNVEIATYAAGYPTEQQCPNGDRLSEHMQGLCSCEWMADYLRRILDGPEAARATTKGDGTK